MAMRIQNYHLVRQTEGTNTNTRLSPYDAAFRKVCLSALSVELCLSNLYVLTIKVVVVTLFCLFVWKLEKNEDVVIRSKLFVLRETNKKNQS